MFLLHSEMEYVLGQRIRRKRERLYRPRQTYFSLSEEECRRKLRLTRQAVTDVCHLLADELGTDAPCPYAFPVAVKVTAALHFNASGLFQHPLSSVTSGVVQHAVEYIQFPVTPDSQERAKQAFWAKYGFPGVLGYRLHPCAATCPIRKRIDIHHPQGNPFYQHTSHLRCYL